MPAADVVPGRGGATGSPSTLRGGHRHLGNQTGPGPSRPLPTRTPPPPTSAGPVTWCRYWPGSTGSRCPRRWRQAAMDLATPPVDDPRGLCELVSQRDPAGMADGAELASFAVTHRLPLVSIAEIAAYRRRLEPQVMRCAETALPPLRAISAPSATAGSATTASTLRYWLDPTAPMRPCRCMCTSNASSGDVFRIDGLSVRSGPGRGRRGNERDGDGHDRSPATARRAGRVACSPMRRRIRCRCRRPSPGSCAIRGLHGQT